MCIRDSDQEVYVPNAFTPNGDTFNDLFEVFPSNGGQVTRLRVYDRWGSLVFDNGGNPQNLWDGSFSGQELPEGVYVYQLEVVFPDRTRRELAGDISLIR